MTSEIIVLATGKWRSGGGVDANQRMVGQVTKCLWFGIVFYVRENLNGANSFVMSAGQRWGEKCGNVMDSRQILDLCTVDPNDWEAAADVVQSLDHKQRPVRSHRTFTPAWAEKHLAESNNSSRAGGASRPNAPATSSSGRLVGGSTG